MAVPKTTSETLKHKINPSAGETAPQAVDVLLYTPGKATAPGCDELRFGLEVTLAAVKGKPCARIREGVLFLAVGQNPEP